LNASEALRQVPAREHRVTGPVAFGESRRRLWAVVWQDVRSGLRLRYHDSVLGFVWSIANPLLMFIVLYLWFSRIIKFGGDIPNYAAMIVFNLMLFRFVIEAIGTSVGSLVAREGFVRRASFPIGTIPLARVLASSIDLLLAIPVVLLISIVVGVDPTWTWLGLPLVVLVLWLLALGGALLLSALYVFIRDVHQLWTVGARVLFFATPVLYPIELAPDRFREILGINPLAPILTISRKWMIDPGAPGVAEAMGGWGALIAPTLVFFGVCIGGFLYFRRRASSIPESI
jgi:ABC-type polysaccharide/polyol phosphate export permease